MIGEDQEIADDYLAIIEINHKNSQMSASITCPVLALDHFPKSTLDIINSPSVWKIPYDTMRNLFKMEEIVCGDEPKKWQFSYSWQVTIKEKKN